MSIRSVEKSTTSQIFTSNNSSGRNLTSRIFKNFEKPRLRDFILPKSKIDVATRFIRGVVLGTAAIFTTPLLVGINETLLFLNLAPSPQSKEIISNEQPFLVDSSNPPLLRDVYEAVAFEFANQDAAQRSETIARKPPCSDDIKELNTYLWGENGLDSNNIIQNKDECQIVADMVAISLVPANVERYLKPNLRVTGYNLSRNKEEFFIDMEVTINGKTREVKYSDLKEWSVHNHLNPPLAPHAFIYALEKELEENYVAVPRSPMSASSTLITGEQYYTIPIAFLSDEILEYFLQQAPTTVIKLGSHPEYIRDSLDLPESEISTGHAIAVKGMVREDGKLKVIVKEFGIEKKIPLKYLKHYMLYISVPARLMDIDKTRDSLIWLGALFATLGLSVSSRRLEEKRDNKALEKNLEASNLNH